MLLIFQYFRDLAARNCQLTSEYSVKIGDYGTSIEKFKVCSCTCLSDICVNHCNVCSQEEYYYAGEMALPIRWCAPETLVCTDSTIETKEVYNLLLCHAVKIID